jgi:hypothetical protein
VQDANAWALFRSDHGLGQGEKGIRSCDNPSINHSWKPSLDSYWRNQDKKPNWTEEGK